MESGFTPALIFPELAMVIGMGNQGNPVNTTLMTEVPALESQSSVIQAVNVETVVEQDTAAGKEALLSPAAGKMETEPQNISLQFTQLIDKKKPENSSKDINQNASPDLEKTPETVKPKTSQTGNAQNSLWMSSENRKELEVIKEKENMAQPAPELKKLMDMEAQKYDLQRPREQTRVEKSEMPVQLPVENDSKAMIFAQRWDQRWSLEPLVRTTAVPLQGPFLADPEEIISQLVQKTDLLIKQNASEIKMQLHPEFLGKMTIKIVMEDGALTLRFVTDNLLVKQALDNNMAGLRQSFENQGLKVEKTEVNVQVNADSQQHESQQQNRQDHEPLPFNHRNWFWEDQVITSAYQPEEALDENTETIEAVWWDQGEETNTDSIDYRI